MAIFTVSIGLLIMTCCLYTGGNWFFVAFISVLLGITLLFLPFILHSISLPDFLNNKKVLIYFLTETILLIILLFVCNLYAEGMWFFKIGLPITLFSLSLPWGMMFIVRYMNINKFFKVAGCLAFASAFQYSLQGVLSIILKDGLYGFGFRFNFSDWSKNAINGNVDMIVFLVLFILAIIFTILGIYSTIRKDVKNP